MIVLRSRHGFAVRSLKPTSFSRGRLHKPKKRKEPVRQMPVVPIPSARTSSGMPSAHVPGNPLAAGRGNIKQKKRSKKNNNVRRRGELLD